MYKEGNTEERKEGTKHYFRSKGKITEEQKVSDHPLKTYLELLSEITNISALP